METVFVLLMMTVGLSHGIEIHCDARQNGTQCYGAVNGTVSLRLVEKIETGLEYKWERLAKLNEIVFEFKRVFRPIDKYQSRSSFNDSSGTFDMRDVTRSDEAQYVLLIFDSKGISLQTTYLHLFVQAAVSPPKMSSECLSQAQRSVSCSCQGDSVRYTWTLNGEPLRDEHLFSGHLDTQNITLTQALSGVLACGVNNRVSSYITVEDIKPCPGFKLIECTLSNGTHIPPRWVSDNDSLCATTATTPVTARASVSCVVWLIVGLVVGILLTILLLLLCRYTTSKAPCCARPVQSQATNQGSVTAHRTNQSGSPDDVYSALQHGDTSVYGVIQNPDYENDTAV